MSEPSYEDGEVVWVKWSSCWWPGEVWASSRVPGDILTSLRKPVIAFVKFFQEESFEFVRSHNNIMKYNCEQKLDYIKKGMDKHRTNNKKMSNFPADVAKAEQLTGGDENILKSFETPTKQKPTSFATPEKSFTETTPVPVSRKSAGAYNSSSKVQFSANPAPKSDKKFTCTLCDFSTERMNLLMLHIKNHSSSFPSRANDPSPAVVKKVSAAKSPTKKYIEPTDSIADDVRKIKESMKKESKPSTSAKKSREPAKSTPTGRASRSTKKEEKIVVKEEVAVKVEEKPNPVNELKNELLADWSDDDDEVAKSSPPPPKPSPAPITAPEKVGESSRSIRNIPKKQRVSEIYIKSEPVKIEQQKIEQPKVEMPARESSKNFEEPTEDVLPPPEVSNKTSKASKRKFAIAEAVSKPEPKKLPEVTDDSLLMATAELLNDTEVPKVESAQQPSTFHKSNDIDKRYLPPKERNKRIFRASKSHETPPPKAIEPPAMLLDNNGSMTKESDLVVASSPIQNELMLPHKKKQSSRLLTSDKPSPVREMRSVREVKPETPVAEPRTRKKRKSTETNPVTKSTESIEVDTNSVTVTEKQEAVQSPLRDTLDVSNEVISSESAASATSNFISIQRRGVKRRNSQDPHQLTEDLEKCSEPKKLYKYDVDAQRKSIVVACSSETICISSKGQLSVARRDSVKTTQASSVVVTSQVIITEATRAPTVSTAPTTETVFTSKPIISATIKIPHQSLALKFPAEELMEMKKQGLVTVGVDKKNKFTEKGKQIYKEIKEKTAEVAIEQMEKAAPEPEQIKAPELPSPATQAVEEVADVVMKELVEVAPEEKEEPVENKDVEESLDVEKQPEIDETPVKESNGTAAPEIEIVDESTNNNDIEKEPIVVLESPAKDVEDDLNQEPVENGKEVDNEAEVPEDPNNSGAGLIALQAETFGGPPNCFYLCRQVEDRYEPVDNQILVLNAQNALVPYEGDMVTEDSLAPSEVASENLTGYPQLSPGSNIIINTPLGQKIELTHFAILQLQEQADENGMATVEMSGEQLELNINGILEAINAQQEEHEGEALLPGAMLIDGDGALILDTTELPIEMHHSATQVSETLTKPIMSATIAPEIISAKATTIAETIASKNLNIEDSLATIGVTTQLSRSNIHKSLELPITITNPTIVETVNHRKLAANAQILGELAEVAIESFVVQSTDNGSQE